MSCVEEPAAIRDPRQFTLGSRIYTIDEIIDRWISPQQSFYKVRTNDTGIYIIRHKLYDNMWDLYLYDSGVCEQTRLSC